MIQFVVGAAAGYVLGTKAGRKRFDQIKKVSNAAVHSPASQAALRATRRAIANKLDPEPRMREVKNLRGEKRKGMGRGKSNAEDRGYTVLEPDSD